METLWNILDFSGNGIFNSLDIILIWCYGITLWAFIKYVAIKKNS